MALALQAGVNCHGVLPLARRVPARALSRDRQLRRHRRARRERDVLVPGAATAADDRVNQKRQGVRAGRRSCETPPHWIRTHLINGSPKPAEPRAADSGRIAGTGVPACRRSGSGPRRMSAGYVNRCRRISVTSAGGVCPGGPRPRERPAPRPPLTAGRGEEVADERQQPGPTHGARRRPIIAAPPGNLDAAAAAAASWHTAVCPAPRGPGPSRFLGAAHRSAPRSAPTLKEVT